MADLESDKFGHSNVQVGKFFLIHTNFLFFASDAAVENPGLFLVKSALYKVFLQVLTTKR